MPLFALTGGIASGKSTIAARLAEHGASIVDADQIVRDVQSPGSPVLDAIAEEFGQALILKDGSLDRAALGSIVFGDAQALEKLNAIVHPAVRQESVRQFEAALTKDPGAIVVYDVPLLHKAQDVVPWDLIVVADAPASVREQRLVEFRGMSLDEARARIAAQISDEERRAVADVVIDTSGSLAETLVQTDELWKNVTLNADSAQ